MRSLPTNAFACSAVHRPPCCSTRSCSSAIQYGSVSTRVPSMSQRTAAGSSGGIEVLGLGVVDDDRVGRLLGVQLQLLGQLDPDPRGVEQFDERAPVVEVGAGRVAERVAR